MVSDKLAGLSGVPTEPVDGADGALEDGQEGVDDPVLYLCVSLSLLFKSNDISQSFCRVGEWSCVP